MFYFIRHGRLLLPYKDHKEMPFHVLTDLASGRLNPTVDNSDTKKYLDRSFLSVRLKDLTKIYTSPSRRCRDTARLIVELIHRKYARKVEILMLTELKEVQFDLARICRLPSRNGLDIGLINRMVFRALIEHDNCESTKSIFERIDKIFEILKKESRESEVMLITHDFLMRFIEIYIKRKGVPRKFAERDLQKTKRNTYMHGFATDHDLSTFVVT